MIVNVEWILLTCKFKCYNQQKIFVFWDNRFLTIFRYSSLTLSQTCTTHTNVRTAFAVITKKILPIRKNSKKFRHLRKKLRELPIYKLLSESCFNLFCLLVLLVCVLTFESLKVVTKGVLKSMKLLLLWHTSAALLNLKLGVSPSQKSVPARDELCCWLQNAWR